MIKIENVNFTYADGTQALFTVSCEFHSDHLFAVLGESGSGKTTLLNCLGRFLHPQEGTIKLDGEDISTMSEKAFRQKLGVVFQKLHLFPHLNILQNMLLAPKVVQGRHETELKKEATAMLERLGIADLAESYPTQVSGGQAQRAAIARGLMLQPEYLLLDEPTSALDARTSAEFAQWLKELHEETHFIVVTHDLPFAQLIAQKGIYMENGRIVHEGDIETITKTAAKYSV